MTTNNEYLISECPLEAIESAIESFKNKELSEWELHLITRRVNTLKAATAEANKRIAELTQDRNDLNYLCMERLHKIEALQANNEKLREALEEIARDSFVDSWQCKLAEQALSITPAESLQAHDNEVIEKCAKVCDGYIKATFFAHNIRALKEVK